MSPSGVIVKTRNQAPSRGLATRSGTWFVAAKCGGDLTIAHPCRSISDFEAAYGGARATGNQAAWDAIDNFFSEKGELVYVGSYVTDHTEGLALFLKSYGPGQVSVIGEPNTALIYTDIADHCLANNRYPLYDVNVASTVVEMGTLGADLPATAALGAEAGVLCGPWLNISGPNGVVGAGPRQVPASSAVAALCARVDADGNPNRAPGGADYYLRNATSPVLEVTDAEWETLMTAHVNVFRTILPSGTIQLYSFLTALAPDPGTPFWQGNCGRARMWCKDRAEIAGQAYYMKNIDANLHLAGALKKDLDAIMLELYEHDGLYGRTPAEAFSVNVGVTVNNDATAIAASLNAVLQARWSQYARSVEIDLVSVPVAGGVV